MNPNFTIRLAELEDLNAIGWLAQQTWPAAYGDILSPEQLDYMLNLFYSPASLHRQVLEEGQRFLLVEVEEDPIGFAAWGSLGEGIYKLHKLYALPSSQGMGVGKAMLEFIYEDIADMAAAADDGPPRTLRLNVNRHNKARYFYEKMGFSIVGEQDVEIGEGYQMNDYVMERPL